MSRILLIAMLAGCASSPPPSQSAHNCCDRGDCRPPDPAPCDVYDYDGCGCTERRHPAGCKPFVAHAPASPNGCE